MCPVWETSFLAFSFLLHKGSGNEDVVLVGVRERDARISRTKIKTVFVEMELFFLHQVSQITENFRNGHTGQLSFIMVLLLLFTHAARIFTTMQETGDQYILAIFTLSTVFNITMVTQILYYWNATIDAQKKKE